MDKLHQPLLHVIDLLIFFGLVMAASLLLGACQAQPPQPTPSLAPAISPTHVETPPTPAPTTAPITSDPVWDRIQQAGKIVAAISADYPPFAYIDKNFAITGYDLALVQELSRRMGIPMDIRNMAFDGLTDALQLGQIDMAVAAISVTPERDKYIDFSNVYYVGDDAALASQDAQITVQAAQDLAAYRIGVQKGSVYETWLRTALVQPGLMPEQNLLTFDTPQDAINALLGSSPQVDLVIMDYLPAQQATTANPVKIVARSLHQQLYAIAIPQGAATLRNKLNEALTQMQNDGTLAGLAKQWLDVETLPPTPSPAPTEPPATPSACQDGMTFVQDLNYSDNQMRNPPVVGPGATIQKGWRVRNTGNCTWDSRYALLYVGSAPANAPIGGSPAAVQGSVPPGQTYDFYVNIGAPILAGVYQSFWSLRSYTGLYFGDRLYAGFQVANYPTSVPQPSRPSIFLFNATPSQISQGQCLRLDWSFGGQDLVLSQLFRGNQLILQDMPYASAFNDCPPGTGMVVYTLSIQSEYGAPVSADQQVFIYPSLLPTTTPLSPPVIEYFTTDKDQIEMGQCVNLSWSVTGYDLAQVQILRHKDVIGANLPASGTLQDCPLTAGSVTYRLVATSQSGDMVEQSLSIAVLGPLTQRLQNQQATSLAPGWAITGMLVLGLFAARRYRLK